MKSRIWFTSDNHFGHKRILEFCPKTRPFKTTDEMDEHMVYMWNTSVQDRDEVWMLGDFSWHWGKRTLDILNRLKGRIHFIWGNHDQELLGRPLPLRVTWAGHYKELMIDKIEVKLFHFPIHEWHHVHRGAFHFHGHTHGNVVLPGRGLDVGIDGPLGNGDCRLYSWEECKAYCEPRPVPV